MSTAKIAKKVEKQVKKEIAKEVPAIKKEVRRERKAAQVVKAAAPVVKQVAKAVVKQTTGSSGLADALGWVIEKGVQTLSSLGSSELQESAQFAHVQKHLVRKAGTTDNIAPAGTVLLSQPIEPSMFDDANARLTVMASLYTYFKFDGSHFTFTGVQGALVNGSIGMFIVPDPEQELPGDDLAKNIRLCREFKGVIVKLDQTATLSVPRAAYNLNVVQGLGDVRLASQGTFYLIAFTDIDLSTFNSLGVVDFKYNMAVKKPNSLDLAPVPPVSTTQARFTMAYGVPNSGSAGPTNINGVWSAGNYNAMSFVLGTNSGVKFLELPTISPVGTNSSLTCYPGSYRFDFSYTIYCLNSSGSAIGPTPAVAITADFTDAATGNYIITKFGIVNPQTLSSSSSLLGYSYTNVSYSVMFAYDAPFVLKINGTLLSAPPTGFQAFMLTDADTSPASSSWVQCSGFSVIPSVVYPYDGTVSSLSIGRYISQKPLKGLPNIVMRRSVNPYMRRDPDSVVVSKLKNLQRDYDLLQRKLADYAETIDDEREARDLRKEVHRLIATLRVDDDEFVPIKRKV